MFNLCITRKTFAIKVFFQWTEGVKITWGEVQAIGGVMTK